MIKKYKENIRNYIKKCDDCGSKFTFQYRDVDIDWNGKQYIKCPYCNDRQVVGILIPMTFSKKYIKEINKSNEYKLEIDEKQKIIDEYANQIHNLKNEKELILKNREKDLNEIGKTLDEYRSSMTTTTNVICGYINSLKIRKGNISKKEILSILDEIKTTLLK